MKYYIDIKNEELYKLTDVCINLSKKDLLGNNIVTELPKNAIEFKPVLKRSKKLLILTKNPFKNVKLYFNDELNLYIQSNEEWFEVCKILKYELNIGLKNAKELIDKKIREIKP